MLRNPEADWPHVSITHLSEPGSYGLSTEDWRLIHYANGDEELYDSGNDRYELSNLAALPDIKDRRQQLRALAPEKFAARIAPKDESLTRLKWQLATAEPTPASKPDGDPFQVVFINRSKATVKLYWMDRSGKPKPYGAIPAGERKRQQTRPGAVWQINDDADRPLGHFTVGDRTAQAVIPLRSRKTSQ